MDGFAYSAGVSELTWDPIHPSLEVSPKLVYVTQGEAAHIVYSSENATRVTVDGVDSDLIGIVSRTYTALGTTTINITAFGVTGTTPATETAVVVCMGDVVPPVITKNVSIACGPDKDCEEGYFQVPYWTDNADSVSVSLSKDGALLYIEDLPVAEVALRYFRFEATEGVYTMVFTATDADGETATDTCVITCGILAMEEYSLLFIYPDDLAVRPESEAFELTVLLLCDLEIASLDPIVFTKTSGDGDLTFAEGPSVSVDENYVAVATGVKYELTGGDVTDYVQITASITIDGTEYTDSVTLGVISDYLDVTITPSVYPAMVVVDELVWLVDSVIKAYNSEGQDTDFADIVELLGYATPEANWQGRTDITGEVIAYCPGDTWDFKTEVSAVGLTELPAEAFLDGACIVRAQMEAVLYIEDLTAPYDLNNAWASFRLQASVNNGSQMALGLGGADLLGTDTLVLGLPTGIEDDTSTAVTLSAIDEAQQ